MASSEIDPLEIALKYEPPVLGLIYNRGTSKAYIHEIELDHLGESTEDIYEYILDRHNRYLVDVDPD
jgi:hypothetical protein